MTMRTCDSSSATEESYFMSEDSETETSSDTVSEKPVSEECREEAMTESEEIGPLRWRTASEIREAEHAQIEAYNKKREAELAERRRVLGKMAVESPQEEQMREALEFQLRCIEVARKERDKRMKQQSILREMEYERQVQEEIRKKILRNDVTWYRQAYVNGLACYPLKEPSKEDVRRRREAMKRRYKIMKRIRPAACQYGVVGVEFYPGNRRVVIEMWRSMHPRLGIVALMAVINYYCDTYGVYVYSPLPGTGYKYYTGEKILVYVVDTTMSEKQVEKVSKAARNEKSVNGHSLKSTWKVIVALREWQGCPDWQHESCMDSVGYRHVNYWVEAIVAWKCSPSVNYMVHQWNFASYCRKRELVPWPFRKSVKGRPTCSVKEFPQRLPQRLLQKDNPHKEVSQKDDK